MPISLTCSCGARLEIDDKFAGQTIPCPDCNKPLNTAPEPQAKLLPISGLAVTSLILAIAGAFTIVGSLAAIPVGLFAIRQIGRDPDKIGGLNIARAGIIAGGAFTFLTLIMLISGVTFGADSLLREWRHGGDVDYKTEDGATFKIPNRNADRDLTIRRPSSAWGKMKNLKVDDDQLLLALVSLRDDAHLLILQITAATEDEAIDKMAERFRRSDLVKALDNPPAKAPATEPEAKDAPPGKKDKTLELRLGSTQRKFLLRTVKIGQSFYLLAAGTRASRFDRIADDLRQAFDSFKAVEDRDP